MTRMTFCANFRCWLQKPADQSFDREAKEREWTLIAVRDEIIVGGN